MKAVSDKEKLNQWIESVLFNAIESAPDLTDEEVLSDYRAFIKSIKNWTFK